GLRPGARTLVDAGRDEPVGGARREQVMIDADAVVLLPGASLIVPESVMPRRVLTGAERVRHAEIDETSEGAPGLRLEQGVIRPRLRAPGILRFRDDIEIAG